MCSTAEPGPTEQTELRKVKMSTESEGKTNGQWHVPVLDGEGKDRMK